MRTGHGNRRSVRVLRIIKVLECVPEFVKEKEIKRAEAWFCPIYLKTCRFPGYTLHLSCMNCFGRLAQKTARLKRKIERMAGANGRSQCRDSPIGKSGEVQEERRQPSPSAPALTALTGKGDTVFEVKH
jgi:hypothetical protein